MNKEKECIPNEESFGDDVEYALMRYMNDFDLSGLTISLSELPYDEKNGKGFNISGSYKKTEEAEIKKMKQISKKYLSKEEIIMKKLEAINNILQSCITCNGSWKTTGKKMDAINQIQIDLYNNIKGDMEEKGGFSEHI